MRLVLTLFVRDEADIIEAMLRFHLAVGVDFFIVTDNGSTDGTSKILEQHKREGHLALIREPRTVSQEEHVTQMARLAATDFGADWVIDSDADEFWWPPSGSLKQELANVAPGVGRVHSAWWHFPPRPGERPFTERMTVRYCEPQPPRYHAGAKVAHRADPDVIVTGGNHDARMRHGQAAPSTIEVFHFPYRSLDQFVHKMTRAYSIRLGTNLEERYLEAQQADRVGRLDELYRSYVISDRALRRGLRKGSLAIDTRLRDTLDAQDNEETDP